MLPETVQQLPTDKLSELQIRVQNIAKGFIALHVVLLFYPVLCYPGNYVEDSPRLLMFYYILVQEKRKEGYCCRLDF